MLRGYIVKDWVSAIEELGASKPERHVHVLLKIIWEDIFWTFWDNRNEIQQGEKSKFAEVEDSKMAERLKWYLANRHNLLSYYDRHLAQYSVEKIGLMSRRVKKEWLYHLDQAQKAYEIELEQRKGGQRTITSFFVQPENINARTVVVENPEVDDPTLAPEPD